MAFTEPLSHLNWPNEKETAAFVYWRKGGDRKTIGVLIKDTDNSSW